MVVKPDCSWIKNLQEEVASLTAAGARTRTLRTPRSRTPTAGGGDFTSGATHAGFERDRTNNDSPSLRLAEQLVATDTALSKQMPMRLVDYFVVFGTGELAKDSLPPSASEPSLDEGSDADAEVKRDEIDVCDLRWEPRVTDRYPLANYNDCPLSERSALFAFPQRIRIRSSPLPPHHHSYVLTNEEGVKQYAANLVFWEKIDAGNVAKILNDVEAARHSQSSRQSPAPGRQRPYQRDLYWPKCISILSHWAFLRPFVQYLRAFYRIIKTPGTSVPVERLISQLAHQVPVPPQGRIQVQLNIGDQLIMFRRSPPNQLPRIYVSPMTIFRCLSPPNVVTLFSAFLLELPIVLISSHFSVLAEVAEALCSLIYPFVYQGVYMPILPESLLDFIYAPVPFLAGIHKSYDVDMPEEIVTVDLDQDRVSVSARLEFALLPPRDGSKLVKKLQQYANFSPSTQLLATASATLVSAGKTAKESFTSLATAAKNSSMWTSVARLKTKQEKAATSSSVYANGSSVSEREDSRSVSSSVGAGGSGGNDHIHGDGGGAGGNNGTVVHGRAKTSASSQNSTPTKSYHEAVKRFPLSDKAFPLGEPVPIPVKKKGMIGLKTLLGGNVHALSQAGMIMGDSATSLNDEGAGGNSGAKNRLPNSDDFGFLPDASDVAEIQQSFLRLFCSLFRNYREFFTDLRPTPTASNATATGQSGATSTPTAASSPTPTPIEVPPAAGESEFISWEDHYDYKAFIAASHETRQKFLEHFGRTQMFSLFITERVEARLAGYKATPPTPAAGVASPASPSAGMTSATSATPSASGTTAGIVSPRPRPPPSPSSSVSVSTSVGVGGLSLSSAERSITPTIERPLTPAEQSISGGHVDEDPNSKVSSDIRFFDESITAKLNRSIRAHRIETPFLDNESDDIKKTFQCDPPTTSDLSDDASYTYSIFPELQPRLFGPSVLSSSTQRLMTVERMSSRNVVSQMSRLTLSCREEMYRVTERASMIGTDATVWIKKAYVEPDSSDLTYDITIRSAGKPDHLVARSLGRLRQFDTQWRSEFPQIKCPFPKIRTRKRQGVVVHETGPVEAYLQALVSHNILLPYLASFFECDADFLRAPAHLAPPSRSEFSTTMALNGAAGVGAVGSGEQFQRLKSKLRGLTRVGSNAHHGNDEPHEQKMSSAHRPSSARAHSNSIYESLDSPTSGGGKPKGYEPMVTSTDDFVGAPMTPSRARASSVFRGRKRRSLSSAVAPSSQARGGSGSGSGSGGGSGGGGSDEGGKHGTSSPQESAEFPPMRALPPVPKDPSAAEPQRSDNFDATRGSFAVGDEDAVPRKHRHSPSFHAMGTTVRNRLVSASKSTLKHSKSALAKSKVASKSALEKSKIASKSALEKSKSKVKDLRARTASHAHHSQSMSMGTPSGSRAAPSAAHKYSPSLSYSNSQSSSSSSSDSFSLSSSSSSRHPSSSSSHQHQDRGTPPFPPGLRESLSSLPANISLADMNTTFKKPSRPLPSLPPPPPPPPNPVSNGGTSVSSKFSSTSYSAATNFDSHKRSGSSPFRSSVGFANHNRNPHAMAHHTRAASKSVAPVSTSPRVAPVSKRKKMFDSSGSPTSSGQRPTPPMSKMRAGSAGGSPGSTKWALNKSSVSSPASNSPKSSQRLLKSPRFPVSSSAHFNHTPSPTRHSHPGPSSMSGGAAISFAGGTAAGGGGGNNTKISDNMFISADRKSTSSSNSRDASASASASASAAKLRHSRLAPNRTFAASTASALTEDEIRRRQKSSLSSRRRSSSAGPSSLPAGGGNSSSSRPIASPLLSPRSLRRSRANEAQAADSFAGLTSDSSSTERGGGGSGEHHSSPRHTSNSSGTRRLIAAFEK